MKPLREMSVVAAAGDDTTLPPFGSAGVAAAVEKILFAEAARVNAADRDCAAVQGGGHLASMFIMMVTALEEAFRGGRMRPEASREAFKEPKVARVEDCSDRHRRAAAAAGVAAA